MRAKLLTGIVLASLCAWTAGARAADECDRSDSKQTASPDGHWVASVQEEVCATAQGAAAAITVIVSAAADPTDGKRVFQMTVPRSRDDWPRVRWESPTSLHLRVPNLAEVMPPVPEYSGIRITLEYCNDNPDDRARVAAYKTAIKQWQANVTAWAKKRKEDPDGAGARPERPQEPRVSPGRCTD
jgi:hypothetical protein